MWTTEINTLRGFTTGLEQNVLNFFDGDQQMEMRLAQIQEAEDLEEEEECGSPTAKRKSSFLAPDLESQYTDTGPYIVCIQAIITSFNIYLVIFHL